MNEANVKKAYELAKETYAAILTKIGHGPTSPGCSDESTD